MEEGTVEGLGDGLCLVLVVHVKTEELLAHRERQIGAAFGRSDGDGPHVLDCQFESSLERYLIIDADVTSQEVEEVPHVL